MPILLDNFSGAVMYSGKPVSVEITSHEDFRRKFMNTKTGEVFYIDQLCAIGETPPECSYCGCVCKAGESFCVDGCGAPLGKQ